MTDDPMWEPTSDYDDQMDAVERGLLSYDSTHCKHGTFVGNWAGPDYMCGYCEMGVTDEEFEEGKRLAREADQKRAAARERWEQILLLKDEPDFQEVGMTFLQSEEGKWLFR